MIVSTFNMDLEGIIAHSNAVKDCLLGQMCQDGIISEEEWERLHKTYYVTLVKRGWISRLFKRAGKKDRYELVVSKVDLSEEENDEEK